MLYPDFIPNQDFRVRLWKADVTWMESAGGWDISIQELTLVGWTGQDDDRDPVPFLVSHGDRAPKAVDLDEERDWSPADEYPGFIDFIYTASGDTGYMLDEFIMRFTRFCGEAKLPPLITRDTEYTVTLRNGQTVLDSAKNGRAR